MTPRRSDGCPNCEAWQESHDEKVRELVLTDIDRDRLKLLLHRWLSEASAMGGGPRALLTQDTLDAVGMPDA